MAGVEWKSGYPSEGGRGEALVTGGAEAEP